MITSSFFLSSTARRRFDSNFILAKKHFLLLFLSSFAPFEYLTSKWTKVSDLGTAIARWAPDFPYSNRAKAWSLMYDFLTQQMHVCAVSDSGRYRPVGFYSCT